MPKETIVEIWGVSKEPPSVYTMITQKVFDPNDIRAIGRFERKWQRKRDRRGEKYDIENYTIIKNEEVTDFPIVEVEDNRDFIMNRFTRIV